MEKSVGPLSWDPRVRDTIAQIETVLMVVLLLLSQIFYHSHFATAEDTDELTRIGEQLSQSQKIVASAERHADWCLRLPPSEPMPDSLKRVESRMSMWAVLPPAHGEEFCWIRQEAGQELPVLSDDEAAARDPLISTSGRRKVSVILHLNSVLEGGKTLLPKAGNGPLTVPAYRGDAILIWNQHPDRSESAGAVWGSQAPSSGVKWLLVRWLRDRPLRLKS